MANGFQDLLVELFEQIGGVSFRKMFGGVGIFRQGIMFALVADDTLYLKADDASSISFNAEGCGPFVYDGKHRPTSKSIRDDTTVKHRIRTGCVHEDSVAGSRGEAEL